MLLATGPSVEFIKLIQILCWILLPIAAIVMLLTVLFHYRRRKKAMRQSTVSEEEFIKMLE
jgi:cytochrome c-type biogenesis protein CcmH/NrfF